MRTEHEINLNKSDIENSGLKLDEHMTGYVAALEWMLNYPKEPDRPEPKTCDEYQLKAQHIWTKIKPFLDIKHDTKPAEEENLKFLAVIGFSDEHMVIKICGGGEKLRFYQLVTALINCVEGKEQP